MHSNRQLIFHCYDTQRLRCSAPCHAIVVFFLQPYMRIWVTVVTMTEIRIFFNTMYTNPLTHFSFFLFPTGQTCHSRRSRSNVEHRIC